ncbi:MAG: CHAT domain-containing tetratricopeptide repeat protein [Paludibacteraceae bacterium]|nr:CHAT domain-containing tetratricopeptide repeat protein [Paludibacteraceae bacterium]
MKKSILLLICVTFGTLLFAQYSADKYKYRMIENINKGKFKQAIKLSKKVEDWDFNPDDEKAWLKVEEAREFALYIDSIGLPKPLLARLLTYEYNVMSNYYQQSLDNTTSISVLETILSLQRICYGNCHSECASSLNTLGNSYYDLGDYAKAESYYLESMAIYKSVYGEQHSDYADALNNLGVLYHRLGDYSKAESYYLESMAIYKSVYGEQHPGYAGSLNNLGLLYYSMGDYGKAEPYYLESKAIYKSVYGEQHPAYADVLNNLGLLYYSMGDYGKAESYYLESKAIRKSVYGEQHPDYATSLHNLGLLYYSMGDYAKAESYYLESMSIYKSVYGERHPAYADALNNLGLLYFDMGDYSKAEQYLLESLVITKAVYGEQHPDYATSLSNLGNLYSDMGAYAKAELYYLESMAIRKSVYGDRHPAYADVLNNLGLLYSDMGAYAKAELYYLESMAIYKSVYGEQHPDYAASLHNLGALYHAMGVMLGKAESYYLESMAIRKSVYGDRHPAYAGSLSNLGILYSDMGAYAKAEPYYTQDMSIKKHLFIQATDFMSERERDKYWATMQETFYKTYPIFSYRYYAAKPSISAFAYNNELFTKGLLLSSSKAVQSSILQSNDTALIRRWRALTAKKQQILALSDSVPQPPYLAELQQQAEDLEKEVIRTSAAFRLSRARWRVTWDSVRAHLSEDEVAIEYFSAPINADSTMYCALLLRHSSAYPELIPLFNEKEALALIDTGTDSYINQTYQYMVDDTVTIGNGKRLSDLVWGNLLPYINPGETIYFSPSGLLYQLGIESLPFDEHRTMSDVFTLLRVSSTREVVFRPSPVTHATATLYGGISYTMSGEELLAESAQYATVDLLASRGIENDTLNRGSVRYLPYTKKEVDDISDQLTRNHLAVKVYTAAAANEESIKALSGRYQHILHIATHGFYWSDSTAKTKDLFSHRLLMMGDNQPAPVVHDPLNRCGLLFAGANLALMGRSADLPEGVQDGILTAKEISLLEFRETDLVVLSACETGTGDITGEGVFGLQRAFKQAGVKTIIMSLWKVSDPATQMFMSEFYANWLDRKQSKREAFRNAQNAVRAHYTEPYYWAGSVMLD